MVLSAGPGVAGLIRYGGALAAVVGLGALAWNGAVLARALAPRGGGTSVPPAQRMAVPAYFSPGSYWTQMERAHPPLQLAVMNPASGPGGSADPQYVSAVRAAQHSGISVVGYVDTDYARRSLSAVEADIDAYYRWYHVDGIFFDRATTSCANEPYYAELNRYVKAKGGPGQTILNPGTQTNQCYIAAADILLTFEGSDNTYLHSYSAPSWVSSYPSTRFWHVIYATATRSAMARAVQLSKQRHAGFVYVTPEALPNPYHGLPTGSYWTGELSAISG